jgi:hypothetical protein
VETFDKLVMDLKRDAEKSRLLSEGTSASSAKAAPEVDVQIHSPQPRRLIDLKNLRAEMGGENSVPSTPTQAVDGPTRCEAVSGNENGPSPPKKLLRGNGKPYPKRPPIPRWDDVDNDWQHGSGEGAPFKFGITSRVMLT